MAEETVDQFLARRERELIAQIAAIRGQLAPKDAELLQIRRVKAALKLEANLSKSLDTEARLTPSSHLSADYDAALVRVIGGQSMPPPYDTMTIKELTIQALLDHFPNGGTAAAIREFIHDAYSRTIEPGSMRAQMHRLKVDKVLKYEPETDTWNFEMGKRALYDTYNHPTSRKVMKELQDDNPAEDKAFLEAATKLAWREEDDKS